jgi:hypothetical protein
MELCEQSRAAYKALPKEARTARMAKHVVDTLRRDADKGAPPALREAWAVNAAYIRLDADLAANETGRIFCSTLAALIDMMVEVLPLPGRIIDAEVPMQFLAAMGAAMPTLLSILPQEYREIALQEVVSAAVGGTAMVDVAFEFAGAKARPFYLDEDVVKH